VLARHDRAAEVDVVVADLPFLNACVSVSRARIKPVVAWANVAGQTLASKLVAHVLIIPMSLAFQVPFPQKRTLSHRDCQLAPYSQMAVPVQGLPAVGAEAGQSRPASTPASSVEMFPPPQPATRSIETSKAKGFIGEPGGFS
jgi:hypothetical protein